MLKLKNTIFWGQIGLFIGLFGGCGDASDNAPNSDTDTNLSGDSDAGTSNLDTSSGTDHDTGEPQYAAKYSLANCPYTSGLGERFWGIKFDIEGDFGPELRVTFTEEGYDINPYFNLITAAYMRDEGLNTIEAPTAEAAIYWADEASEDYRTSAVPNIVGISFQVPASDSAELPYHICIQNIELVFTSDDPSNTAMVYVPFMPNADGWMGTDENEIGLQGSWYSYREDGEYSTIEMNVTEATSVCADGVIAQVVDVDDDGELDYADVWGAGFGFDLCSESSE